MKVKEQNVMRGQGLSKMSTGKRTTCQFKVNRGRVNLLPIKIRKNYEVIKTKYISFILCYGHLLFINVTNISFFPKCTEFYQAQPVVKLKSVRQLKYIILDDI